MHARLTEIGTLDLWCSEIGRWRSWRLQFDVRSATQTDVAAHESQAEGEGMVNESVWNECRALIERTFGPEASSEPSGQKKGVAHNRPRVKARLCVFFQRDHHADTMIVVLGEAESGSAGTQPDEE